MYICFFLFWFKGRIWDLSVLIPEHYPLTLSSHYSRSFLQYDRSVYPIFLIWLHRSFHTLNKGTHRHIEWQDILCQSSWSAQHGPVILSVTTYAISCNCMFLWIRLTLDTTLILRKLPWSLWSIVIVSSFSVISYLISWILVIPDLTGFSWELNRPIVVFLSKISLPT